MWTRLGLALARRDVVATPLVSRHLWRAPGIAYRGQYVGMSTHVQHRASSSPRLWAAGLATGAGILSFALLRSQGSEKNAYDQDALSMPEDSSSQPSSPKPRPTVGGLVFTYLIEPILVFKRFLVLAFIFIPVLLTLPLIFMGKHRVLKDKNGRSIKGERYGALLWYKVLVSQMERAGPTFVKLGQWAGSRRDLFPDELCNRFAKLHSNNRPHSFRYTQKVLERVFGKSFDEIFVSFDKNPVGIGAVGQVYKAVLHERLLPHDYLVEKDKLDRLSETAENIGRELALTYEHDESLRRIPGAAVAIKVLHPKVHQTIGYDIQIMRFFANLINCIPGMAWVSLPEEVDRFSALMVSQLDLRQEASNLKRFERNFAGRGGTVTFPRPLQAFCSQDVLVEEMIEAVPLKYFMKLGGKEYDSCIAEMGLDAFLRMLLIDNFTHADLHPGNIMVKFYRPTTRSMLQNVFSRIFYRYDPEYVLGHRSRTGIISDERIVDDLLSHTSNVDEWREHIQMIEEEGYLPELVMLDAGLISELSPKNLRNFLDLFSAIVTFDGRRAGTLMVERCRTPELVTNKEEFVELIGNVVDDVKSDTFSLSRLNIGDVLSQVLSAVQRYHVKMEADFVDTVLSILILEGIGRRLDPELDLFKSAIPILRSLGHKMSMDGTPLSESWQGMDFSTLVPMLKLWIYTELRGIFVPSANAPQVVDAFVRYGWFSD
ncbi:hypothetical protein MEQU1_002521 [Malassezia equina]|uniref:ABC1 atypical kinase-like domain-containing protein n=1 Tax=Malassezia equina TaxID=1381935 RepID=A0AAF0IZR4_9BASI|nr:hypothetical protein MEQU1_002521 [Malassezia equina]